MKKLCTPSGTTVLHKSCGFLSEVTKLSNISREKLIVNKIWIGYFIWWPIYIYIYIYISVSELRSTLSDTRLHCFLTSHITSFRFLSFMAFFIISIQFFFGLPGALFCFGIQFMLVCVAFLLPFFEHGRTMNAGSVQFLL